MVLQMDIETIIQANSLEEWAKKAGADLDKVAGTLRSACPIHKGDNETSFVIYTDGGKQKWKCWTHDCGQGDVIDFIAAWKGITFKEALEFLGGKTTEINPEELRQRQMEYAARINRELQEKIELAQRVQEELNDSMVWIQYHENLTNDSRRLWNQCGIPEYWQDYWMLGYNQFTEVWHRKEKFMVPTMTIPIFEPVTCDIINIKHRVINPPVPGIGTYRQEKHGIPAAMFTTDLEHPLAGSVLIVEGEKKAMVTHLTVNLPGLQVVGLPGKSSWRHMIDTFKDCDPVYICMDPDADTAARELAIALGPDRCRLMRVGEKIDDAIVEGLLDGHDIRRMMKDAVKLGWWL
jgi:hypothetical protein